MNPRDILEERIGAALAKAGAPPGTPASVGLATRPEFGDYQSNGIMAAAKKLKTNPRQLAASVLDVLDVEDLAAKVDIAGPGFINVTLKSEWLAERLEGILADPRLGVAPTAVPQRVVADYSHPNLAKEMHIGHLRSTVIGDAVVRVLEFLGHEVIRHNHVGDWGTQFGMLIAYMDRLEDQADLGAALADLETFYQAANQLFNSDETFANLAREYVVKLQSGDPHCRAAWQRFIDESLAHGQEIYDRLSVTLSRDHVKAESAYNDQLSGIIEALDQQGLLQESQGAQCVFLEEFKNKKDEITPVIVQKTGGGFLYATTDLAAVRYRATELGADRILYIVDARQSFHLKQIFAVARAAGFAPDTCSLEHHSFGTILGKDNKPFRSRSGGLVKLMDVLEEAEERALALVGEKSPELDQEQRRQIARVVGIGSIKYSELSFNRTTDYIFDWDKMLSLDGNTAPYLQYSYVRVKSIFRRGGLEEAAFSGGLVLTETAEHALGLKLLQFSDAVQLVAQECYPHLLCNYLYELAEVFMRFYESCPVLRSDEPVRTSRLMLCLLTAKTIEQGLGLLGIEVIERM